MGSAAALLRLPPADAAVIVRAWVLFARVDWTIAKKPYTHWPTWMRLDSDVSNATADEQQQALARRLVRLSEIAGRHHLREMNCLRRCFVQRALLTQYGVAAQMRVGVKKGDTGIDAHSWLTLNNEVLNDSADVCTRYAQFESSVTDGVLSSFSS